MELIKADKRHIPLIQDIVAETWPHTYGAIQTEGQIRYMIDLFYKTAALEQQMAQGHQFLLLMDDTKAIGFAGFEPGYNGRRQTKLHKLYVLPGIHGKGSGKQLLDAVKEATLAAGHDRLLLNVNRYNKATGFYEKQGFTITGEEDIDIGNGYFMNDYVMEWLPE